MSYMFTAGTLLAHLQRFSREAPIHIEGSGTSEISTIVGFSVSATDLGAMALRARKESLQDPALSIATVDALARRLAALNPDLPIRIEDQDGGKVAVILYVIQSPVQPDAVALVHDTWRGPDGA